MKKIYLLTALVLGSLLANSQAREVPFTYDKKEQPSYTIELNYPPAIVEQAMINYFQDKFNSNPRAKRGIRKYEGVVLNEISTEKLDILWKAEAKGRREKDKTILTMLVSTGYDNYVSSQSNYPISANAITFLNNLTPLFGDQQLVVNIEDKRKEVKSAEDKLSKLESEEKKTEENIQKLQSKLEEIRNSKVQQKTEIARLQEELTKLQANQ